MFELFLKVFRHLYILLLLKRKVRKYSFGIANFPYIWLNSMSSGEKFWKVTRSGSVMLRKNEENIHGHPDRTTGKKSQKLRLVSFSCWRPGALKWLGMWRMRNDAYDGCETKMLIKLSNKFESKTCLQYL